MFNEKRRKNNYFRFFEYQKYIPPVVVIIIFTFYFILILSTFILPFLSGKLSGVDYPYIIINNSFYSGCLLWFFFVFSLVNLLISLIMTIFTKGQEIPEKSIWDCRYCDPSVSPQENIEHNALKLLEIEEELTKNKNKIYLKDKFTINDCSSHSTNDSASISISSEDFYVINERDEKNQIRFCHTCNKIKPDRAHHCKYCNKCYLKLDHHCIWLNNCISFTNQKYFLCFIFYVWILGILFLFTYHKQFSYSFNVYKKKPFQIYFITTYLLAILLTALTFVLWLFNLQMVLNNFTSFEYNKLHKNLDFSFRNKINYNKVDAYANFEEYESVKSPYDVGKLKNWTQVYGENAFLWFVPVRPRASGAFSNGINFEQNDKEAFEIIKSI